MSYVIQTVSNRRLFKDFLRLPFEIYRNDPNWVPPLLSEVRRNLNTQKNPYFKNAGLELFICKKDQHPVSRAALIIDRRYNQIRERKTAYFGYFESFDDPAAANLLFAEIENYCRRSQMEVLEGPFNPNHYSELGLQANHFTTLPSFFQNYNPEYYLSLLEEAGFSLSTEMFTFKNENIAQHVRENLNDQLQPIHSSRYTLRSFDMQDFKDELERIREVFNDAFAGNWHFLPLSREEYLFSAKYLKMVTGPELIKIVMDKDEPVGVLQCVLDTNPILKQLRGKVNPVSYLRFLTQKKRIKNLTVFAVGIKKAHQHGEVFQLLFQAMCQMALNFKSLETTWMMPQNIPVKRACQKLGLIPDKRFLIVKKDVPFLSASHENDGAIVSLTTKKEPHSI